MQRATTTNNKRLNAIPNVQQPLKGNKQRVAMPQPPKPVKEPTRSKPKVIPKDVIEAAGRTGPCKAQAAKAAVIYGRKATAVVRAGVGPGPGPVGVAATTTKGKKLVENKCKSKLANRSYDVYAKQTGKKKSSTVVKPMPMPKPTPDLIKYPMYKSGSRSLPTRPSKASFDTMNGFYVPLDKNAKSISPRDFQLLKPAGERSINRKQHFMASKGHRDCKMSDLVAATRPLLPQWLPFDDIHLLPEDDDNVWKRRLQRQDTVTLCSFTTFHDNLLLRDYAGRLPTNRTQN